MADEVEIGGRQFRGTFVLNAAFVVGYTLTAVWWASRITLSVEYVQQEMQAFRRVIESSYSSTQAERDARSANDSLNELRRRLDRVESKLFSGRERHGL